MNKYTNAGQQPAGLCDSTSELTREFSLVEIIVQLWKGKFIIIAAVIVMLCGAGVYLAQKKPVWISTAIITQPDSGKVASYTSLLNRLYSSSNDFSDVDRLRMAPQVLVTDVQQQLFQRFTSSLSAHAGANDKRNYPVNLKITPLDKPLPYPLSLSVTADSAKHAQEQLVQYINEVNDAISQSYINNITHDIELKTNELAEILKIQKQLAQQRSEHRVDALKQALKIAEASGIVNSQLTQADNLSDDTLFLLGTKALRAMVDNQSTRPLILTEEYYNAQNQLLIVNQLKPVDEKLQGFEFIASPDMPAQPVDVKKKMVLLLAAFLGMVIGSAVVLGRNLYLTYTQRESD